MRIPTGPIISSLLFSLSLKNQYKSLVSCRSTMKKIQGDYLVEENNKKEVPSIERYYSRWTLTQEEIQKKRELSEINHALGTNKLFKIILISCRNKLRSIVKKS